MKKLAFLMLIMAGALFAFSPSFLEENFQKLERKVLEAKKPLPPLPVPNQPPTVQILSISPNPATVGTMVQFSGNGTDSDGVVVGYEWNSNIDGLLSDQSSFGVSTLKTDTHTVSLRARDNKGSWSSAATATLVVFLPPPPPPIPTPTITLIANPDTISLGSSSTLSWNSTNATTVKLDGEVVDLNGSRVVAPQTTTTYLAIAINQDKIATAATTIIVILPPPPPPPPVKYLLTGSITFYSYPNCYITFDEPGYEAWVDKNTSLIRGHAFLKSPLELRGTVGYGSLTFNQEEMPPEFPVTDPEGKGYHPILEAKIIPHFHLEMISGKLVGWCFVVDTPGDPGNGFIAISKTKSPVFGVSVTIPDVTFFDFEGWSWAGYEPVGDNNNGWLYWRANLRK